MRSSREMQFMLTCWTNKHHSEHWSQALWPIQCELNRQSIYLPTVTEIDKVAPTVRFTVPGLSAAPRAQINSVIPATQMDTAISPISSKMIVKSLRAIPQCIPQNFTPQYFVPQNVIQLINKPSTSIRRRIKSKKPLPYDETDHRTQNHRTRVMNHGPMRREERRLSRVSSSPRYRQVPTAQGFPQPRSWTNTSSDSPITSLDRRVYDERSYIPGSRLFETSPIVRSSTSLFTKRSNVSVFFERLLDRFSPTHPSSRKLNDTFPTVPCSRQAPDSRTTSYDDECSIVNVI